MKQRSIQKIYFGATISELFLRITRGKEVIMNRSLPPSERNPLTNHCRLGSVIPGPSETTEMNLFAFLLEHTHYTRITRAVQAECA